MNIIIIGATSGIGKALFENYVTKDNIVAIVGRRTKLLEQLQKEHPSNTIISKADVTNQQEIGHTIESLLHKLGHIDMAIVCSGVGEINPLLDYTVEKPTIETNVMGWTFVIDMLYNIFEHQKQGHLIAITSVGGLRGEPISPAYSASKAYQINYMEALRKKAFKDNGNILVTDIRPGLVDTAMAKGDGLFWVMPVEKVAKQICHAIQKHKSKAYVTTRWNILASIIKMLPYWIYKRM